MSMGRQEMAIDDARCGMVLAGDLKDERGSVLLPGGVTLSEANLAALRRRGIQRCSIVFEELANGATEEAQQARLQQRLARLFRHSAGVEASDVLLQLLLAYRRNGAP